MVKEKVTPHMYRAIETSDKLDESVKLAQRLSDRNERMVEAFVSAQMAREYEKISRK